MPSDNGRDHRAYLMVRLFELMDCADDEGGWPARPDLAAEYRSIIEELGFSPEEEELIWASTP